MDWSHRVSKGCARLARGETEQGGRVRSRREKKEYYVKIAWVK
jgi:hypothetical protein